MAAQVLLAPLDFMQRRQYLHARGTVRRLLELGAVPVVNENDAVADDEIRFGDNDRLAALVAHLVGAGLLVLLTDTPGLLSADPRLDPSASLIEEIVEVDHALESLAGGPGSTGGSGGMASKIAAAKIAAWSGCARSSPPPGATTCWPTPWPAPPVWAPWCCPTTATCPPASSGSPSPSARPARSSSTPAPGRALERGGVSLLPAGVTAVHGRFEVDDAVEIADADGAVFAKGLVRADARTASAMAGRRSADLPDGAPGSLVHADDLVVLP